MGAPHANVSFISAVVFSPLVMSAFVEIFFIIGARPMPTCFADSLASKKKPHNLVRTLLMAKEADLFGLTTWFVQEIFHQCFWILLFIALPFTTQKFELGNNSCRGYRLWWCIPLCLFSYGHFTRNVRFSTNLMASSVIENRLVKAIVWQWGLKQVFVGLKGVQ